MKKKEVNTSNENYTTCSSTCIRKEKVAMIITKGILWKKKIKYQVQNGALITRCRHLTAGSAVIARSNAKYQGAEDHRIKPKFPVISHSRVTRRGREGDGSWHVERNYDVKEDARVLDGKNSVGQREIKEERKLDVVAEETAPRTFIRRIRTRFLTALPTKSSENFDGGWHNERTKNG